MNMKIEAHIRSRDDRVRGTKSNLGSRCAKKRARRLQLKRVLAQNAAAVRGRRFHLLEQLSGRDGCAAVSGNRSVETPLESVLPLRRARIDNDRKQLKENY